MSMETNGTKNENETAKITRRPGGGDIKNSPDGVRSKINCPHCPPLRKQSRRNFPETRRSQFVSPLRVFGPLGLLALAAFNEYTLQNRVSIKGPRVRPHRPRRHRPSSVACPKYNRRTNRFVRPTNEPFQVVRVPSSAGSAPCILAYAKTSESNILSSLPGRKIANIVDGPRSDDTQK